MILNSKRDIHYKIEKLNINHPYVDFSSLSFDALDNSKIIADLAIPKGEFKGIIIDFPEYNVLPKDYLTLTRYSLLGYVNISLHIRGQQGRSENNIPCSHFPFLDNFSKELYYHYVYQDAIDVVTIAKNIFPNTPIILCGVGQGAALSIVTAAFSEHIDKLFIADCALCDLKNTYLENYDVGYYSIIREFINNYPHHENYLLEQLEKIDVLNFTKDVESKAYYCHSLFETPHPHSGQEKLISNLKNIEVLNYRLEYKKIFQHAFDDFILEKLSKDI